MHHSTTSQDRRSGNKRVFPLHPIGVVAAMIARRVSDDRRPLIYIAETGRRRHDIFALASILAGPGSVCELDAPDGFPGDGLPVTVATAGNRMAMLRWLLDAEKRPSVLITTPAALIRKVPPKSVWEGLHLEIRVGETLDQTALQAKLQHLGYWLDDRVDEPGEAAFRGKVLEIFPAAAPRPCRIEHEDGVVTAIRSYDPVSQRSVTETDCLIVDPASEIVGAEDGATGRQEIDGETLQTGAPDSERFLCRQYERPETVFDYLQDADMVLETGAEIRADEVFDALQRIDADDPHRHAVHADHLDRETWDTLVAERVTALVDDVEADYSVPVFATERQPYKALASFVTPLRDDGYRIVLAGPDGRVMRSAVRKAGTALDGAFEPAADWDAICNAAPSSLLLFDAPITEGFVAAESGVAVISLRNLEGQKAAAAVAGPSDGFAPQVDTFLTGDRVVHIEHGVAVLDGLVPIDPNGNGGDPEGEALSLCYRNDETLLVPMSDIGAVWRYGGASTDVTLDDLKGRTWQKRRDEIFGAISVTADRMVERLTEKAEAKAPKIVPDRVSFERFCARFAYELTADQNNACLDVLDDLASGRPMDRLVCGDVGYGKTEVALRAAAAAVFSGRQVAVIAPTTVLAQQHFREFSARFGAQGVEIVRLSRLVGKDEADAAKTAMQDGTAKIIVGTHAILADDLAFDDLALVIIDEEQRFGSEQKAAMRTLAEGVHILTMTATPIPRTLQSGFVGLSDLSIIATPPNRRSPVKTRVGPFDDAAVRDALAAERARGGQSFVVCPRIEDLEPMAAKLQALVPEQTTVALHGKMKPDEVEDAMLAFAHGEHDVLLATAIVESGLDVANANTMVVCHADRFGLAELHQLRGRVGRGARRGHVLLTTEADRELGEHARSRLEALEEFSTLGAGFDIAARDLDLRGTGELLGDEQAGHVQTIGIGLYRKILERAVALAQGQPEPDEVRPVISLGLPATIPSDYVPEPDMRIELALLLERVSDAATLDTLRVEIEDRFGPMPATLLTHFGLAELRLRCRAAGIAKLDHGPKATALSFTPAMSAVLQEAGIEDRLDDAKWSKSRLIFPAPEDDEADPLAHANDLLDRLAAVMPAAEESDEA